MTEEDYKNAVKNNLYVRLITSHLSTFGENLQDKLFVPMTYHLTSEFGTMIDVVDIDNGYWTYTFFSSELVLTNLHFNKDL